MTPTTVEEKYKILLAHVRRALRRYARPTEPHNIRGGWPRGELAWAMNDDLKEAMEIIGEDVDYEYHA